MKRVRVVYPNRELAFVAQPWEIARLVQKECVRVEYSAHRTPQYPYGTPKSAVLLVAIDVADKILSGPGLRNQAPSITRMKQDPGAGRWVQRADMAGRGAGTLPAQTIHFKLGFREATA